MITVVCSSSKVNWNSRFSPSPSPLYLSHYLGFKCISSWLCFLSHLAYPIHLDCGIFREETVLVLHLVKALGLCIP